MLLLPGLLEPDDSRRTQIIALPEVEITIQELPDQYESEIVDDVLAEPVSVGVPLTVLEQEASKPKPPVKKPSVWMTGFCTDGNHEGTRNLSLKGSLMTACKGTYVIQSREYNCTCECHAVFRQIFELTGIRTSTTPVVPVQDYDLIGKAYAPSVPSMSTPTVTPTAGVVAPTGLLGAANDDTARPLLLPIRVAPTFEPTASGQRARGQLEAEVAHVVWGWFGGSAEPAILPMLTGNAKGAIKSQPPASDGAIYAIFKRWEKAGWCILADKPFRMVSLTEMGVRQLRRYS